LVSSHERRTRRTPRHLAGTGGVPPDNSAIDSLFDDGTLLGPLVGPRRTGLALPLAYAVAVATVVLIMAPRLRDAPSVLSHDVRVTRALVEVPGVPVSGQATATAVSAIDLEGFELVAGPHMQVNRGIR
jgi:hypothetical protein